MKKLLLLSAATTVLLGACAEPATKPQHDAKGAANTVSQPIPVNPFAAPSTLPYELPPFDRITNADYRPALDAGMAEERREIDAIAHNAAAPSFDNTIVAMERAGGMLDRATTVFSNLIASNTNPELEKLNAEYAPKLAAHNDAIMLDPALYARVDQLYQQRATLGLDTESLQLLTRQHRRFVRAGAALSETSKTRLREINGQLSSLTTHFQQNVLKGTKDGAVVVDSAELLDGLSPQQIGAAAEAAKARGLSNKWLITLQNTTIQPVLTQLKDRALRERIYRASSTRGQGGEADNTAVIADIVKLRAERAKLLGYPTHAAYVLEDETAGTPDAVNKMLGQLAPAAIANAHKEAAEIQHVIDQQARAAHKKSFKAEPWDWAFYAEQVRKAKYAYDSADVKPYFELNHVLQDGVFYAAHALYGLSFKERHDLPVYQADVRVFEVFDEDGAPIGLFLADYFARDNKRGGAWMSSYVRQSQLFGLKPVVVNNLNISKPAEGQPVLLTFDEVTTMFHEFGHGLHGLLSNVRYPLLSGTAVPRDFVEYPSQYNEMWARDPGVLANYAKHYQTGAAMPKALFDKVLAAQKFNEGFKTSEYLASALLDQRWHQLSAGNTPAASAVVSFEAEALHRDKVDYTLTPPRYHSGYFSHIFAGGYSAGYYAYLWSEVLARDTEHWINTHGGLTRANGDFLRANVLSRGRSEDPKVLFERFYGGPAEIGPLLEHRGLNVGKTKG